MRISIQDIGLIERWTPIRGKIHPPMNFALQRMYTWMAWEWRSILYDEKTQTPFPCRHGSKLLTIQIGTFLDYNHTQLLSHLKPTPWWSQFSFTFCYKKKVKSTFVTNYLLKGSIFNSCGLISHHIQSELSELSFLGESLQHHNITLDI